ncbi:hypothetical protein PAE2_16 [Pseudomonas phage PAE2]|nr:hypothetical protein PAE2_16 [Pseudomonas phage PAE2]
MSIRTGPIDCCLSPPVQNDGVCIRYRLAAILIRVFWVVGSYVVVIDPTTDERMPVVVDKMLLAVGQQLGHGEYLFRGNRWAISRRLRKMFYLRCLTLRNLMRGFTGASLPLLFLPRRLLGSDSGVCSRGEQTNQSICICWICLNPLKTR